MEETIEHTIWAIKHYPVLFAVVGAGTAYVTYVFLWVIEKVWKWKS